MRMRRVSGVLAAMVVMSALVAVLSPHSARRAPELLVQTVGGRMLSLSAMRGHPVLVNFWSPGCAVCLREMPALSALYSELAPLGLRMLSIAMAYDPPDRVVSTTHRLGLPFPVGIDPQGTAARGFGGVAVTPTTLLVAPNGRVLSRNAGPVDIRATRRRLLELLGQRRPLVADLEMNQAITGPRDRSTRADGATATQQ